MHLYEASSLRTMPKNFSIGVSTNNTGGNGRTLVTGVANGLAKYTGNMVYPYNLNDSQKVDLIAKVAVKPEYNGSYWNFLINFPGFLFWVPAWNGYVYDSTYNVDIELIDGVDSSVISTFTMPIHMDIRHADMDRTWTEISWLEVGAIALIGGIWFIQYDTDVTPLLEREIKTPVGDYIAQEIAKRVTDAGFVQKVENRKAGI